VAGPYSWVASRGGGGGGGIVLCVFSSLLLFLCCTGFQAGYSGRVLCSSQLVFDVFIGVHRLALIRVRFLFLLLCPPPCPGGSTWARRRTQQRKQEADPNQRQPVDPHKNIEN